MTFLYLNSDRMGTGEEEISKKLLKMFLEKLANSTVQVDIIGCVNSGVFLTTEGSEVLESLRKLEARGARIASCGTCLDHYGLRDELLIGEVGSMDMMVEILSRADKIIAPC